MGLSSPFAGSLRNYYASPHLLLARTNLRSPDQYTWLREFELLGDFDSLRVGVGAIENANRKHGLGVVCRQTEVRPRGRGLGTSSHEIGVLGNYVEAAENPTFEGLISVGA
jgi:hypothetical protein